jgi:DNA-binding NtrC family response regulator
MIALAEPNSTIPPDSVSEEILRITLVPPVTAARKGEIAVTLEEKLGPALNRIEREMIRGALRDHKGKVEAAAKALGISRKGLYLKRQRLGL